MHKYDIKRATKIFSGGKLHRFNLMLFLCGFPTANIPNDGFGR